MCSAFVTRADGRNASMASTGFHAREFTVRSRASHCASILYPAHQTSHCHVHKVQPLPTSKPLTSTAHVACRFAGQHQCQFHVPPHAVLLWRRLLLHHWCAPTHLTACCSLRCLPDAHLLKAWIVTESHGVLVCEPTCIFSDRLNVDHVCNTMQPPQLLSTPAKVLYL